MKKNLTFLSSVIAMVAVAHASNFITSGNGTTFTFAQLAALDGSGVTAVSDHAYRVADTLTLAQGDQLVVDHDIDTLYLADGAALELRGKADLQAEGHRLVITRASADDVPALITLYDNAEPTRWKNIDVCYTGVRCATTGGFEVDSCSFCHFQPQTGTHYALHLVEAKASLKATHSLFAYNGHAAIGGAANYNNVVKIEDCTFYHNVLDNKNMPQINLTVADSVIIRNNTIVGDSTMTYSGGIGVSNLMGFSADMYTVIEGNSIDSCRYGLTVTGSQTSLIRDNKIRHNRFEINANNGGSGISLYDPYYRSSCMITGNLIEDNLWGVTIIGGGEVNLGKVVVSGIPVSTAADDYNPGNNVFVNNGNNGVKYDLYNNGTQTIYAQGNTWNVAVQDSAHIEEVITHQADFASLGKVIFMPCQKDIVDGISQPTRTDAATLTRIYTLDGRYVGGDASALRHGVYILQDAKGSRKVMR